MAAIRSVRKVDALGSAARVLATKMVTCFAPSTAVTGVRTDEPGREPQAHNASASAVISVTAMYRPDCCRRLIVTLSAPHHTDQLASDTLIVD
ncbi:hypothetical protein AGR3A_Lc140154 [Agrobacterium tomkonis CFBP 6623]|uniref:Uncharacterized protein n=1 Tax=Agrobacterium tomkonis CFBP 6623 TaxID=1183432 RepID=A0A1S7RNG2_9HYPH|nr:hypothetical protein AGR3A_Lc140154 [Agrobacterium tomkonis CFBP 6623]